MSRFCILYGTLSATMSIKIPGQNPGMFDLGTYVNGGWPDPTWNEVDQIFQVGPNGTVEFHTTYFNPAEHKQVFDLYTRHRYDGYTATAYRTYNVTWTPHFVAWTVDSRVYRNTSGEAANTPPWRALFPSARASVAEVLRCQLHLEGAQTTLTLTTLRLLLLLQTKEKRTTTRWRS